MSAVLDVECPRCGRLQDPEQTLCGLCGNLLRRDAMTVTSTALARPTAPAQRGRASPSMTLEPRTDRAPWIYLAIGLATAPVFGLTPILKFMGWFLASLVHEMGHAAFAWVCGMPAIPAISLAGHAAAVHSEQQLALVAMITIGLATAAWRFFENRARWVALGLVVVLHPAIALTDAKELLHLLAGHAAELLFATLCLWKTLDGGFTASRAERGLYGTVGWYLLGKNVFLCFGLLRSASARGEYRESGSFGLTNDYIRAAEDVLSWRLESVSLLMLVAALFVLPVAIGLWRITLGSRRTA